MKVWKQLASFIRRPRAKLLLLVATSVTTGVLEAGVLVCIVRLALAVDGDGIGSLTIGGVTQSGAAWLVAVTCALLVVIALHVAFAALVSRLSAEVLRSIRAALVDSFVAASWQQQSSESDGNLIHSASTLALQSAHLALLAAIGASSAINLAVLLIVAAVIDWIIVAALAAAGTGLFFFLRPISRHTRTASKDFVEANARFSNVLSTTERISYETRVFGVERAAARRTLDASDVAAREFGRSRFNSLYGASLYRDIALLLLVACLATVAAVGDADIAQTGSVVLITVRAISYAQGVQNARQAVTEQAPNLHAAVADLERFRATGVSDGDLSVTSVNRIAFERVSFAYPGRSPVLDRLDLTILQGEAIGLAGPSGAGKSTVAKLLLRVHEPTDGTIMIDGSDLQDLRRSSWTGLVAAVPQEVRLFDGTIADNVRILRAGISDDRLRDALASANVLDEIEALPEGIDTQVGPSGVGLSGGQRQRIAIARALVGRPQLLIMDEPTSALDAQSDQLITEAISSLKGTVTLILVAHRASTLRICDRVISIDGS